MENWEDHKEDNRYVPLTRQQVLEDAKNNSDFGDVFRNELSDEQIAVIIHYLIRKEPDYHAAGSYLEELLNPKINQLIKKIQEEHEYRNSVESNDPND